jgi:hypothetical protein
MLSVLVVVALRRYDKAYYHCNEQSEYEKQLIFNKTNRQGNTADHNSNSEKYPQAFYRFTAVIGFVLIVVIVTINPPAFILCRRLFVFLAVLDYMMNKPECDKVIEGIVLTVSVPVKHNIRPFRKCLVYVVIVA